MTHDEELDMIIQRTYEEGVKKGIEVKKNNVLETMAEVYRCRYYCLDDMCNKDINDNCVECFHKFISKII